MYNGIVNVYKEKGYTSFDVVAKLRGILHQKKIGHTGTLDPEAEGVLPVCLGHATKVCDLLTDKDKEYEAVLLLGKETDTQDITGTVLREADVSVGEEAVREAVSCFVGGYEQIPPMYSALKVNGQKLCDLARRGVTVERGARRVHIYSIRILDIELPRVRMRICCSKGTYIRTLCQDIGQKLGCYGCMESLLRTRVADFRVEEALRLSEIENLLPEKNVNTDIKGVDNPAEDIAGGLAAVILPVDELFLQLPAVSVPDSPDSRKLLANGNRIPERMICKEDPCEGQVRMYDSEGEFVGLYTYQERERDYKPLKLFK